jgi:hypothetical protein
MSDTPNQLSMDQLTEAVTGGVLRALEARKVSDRPIDFESIIKDRGIFGKIVVTCGIWPNDPRTLPGELPDVQ